MKFLFTLMIFFALQFSIYGQDFWSPTANLSPAGDDWVPSIACNITGTLLAYSHTTGIFRSTNNGAEWTLPWATSLRVSNIKTSPDGKVFAICNNTAGVSIRLSTDDGLTWNEVYAAQHLNNFYSGSGMVFMDNNVLVAVMSFTLGPTLGDIGVEVVRSTNGGLNWQLLFIANGWGGAEDMIKLNDGRILVTTTLSGISASSNNGTTWGALSTFPPIFTNYIQTNSSGHIFVGRNTAEGSAELVYRSTDNGQSWSGAGIIGGLSGGYIYSLYIDHADKIYASVYSSGPTLKTIYRSTDNGSSWQELISGLPADLLVYSFTGNSEDVIFAGTQNMGVFKGSSTVPVELTSFTAEAINNSVHLKWTTGSENNNKGFEIERKAAGSEFEKAGYVSGYGTTVEPMSYSYIDNDITGGKYIYRLKQIDFNGSFEYSPEVEIEIAHAAGFSLEQNYPNPFNPVTKIKFTIPAVPGPSGSEAQIVTLKIFDILGNEAAVLLNEAKPSGSYEITWNAGDMPSGVYFYKLQSGSFLETRKMILTK